MKRRLAVLALLAGALALGGVRQAARATAAGGRGVRLPGAREAGELPQADKATLQLAWREVQAGDTNAAVKRYEKLLRRYPDSAAVRTGLGYARLRAGQVAGRGAGVRGDARAAPAGRAGARRARARSPCGAASSRRRSISTAAPPPWRPTTPSCASGSRP